MVWGAQRGWHHRCCDQPMEYPMPQPNDLSRSLIALEQDATLIAVIEMGQSSWLVAGVVPGVERQPLKKLAVDQAGLLQLLHRWRNEAVRAGCSIKRIAVAYEAGRDGFWLARWLRAHGIEAYVIHASSVPVSREHRRAKTDRLDTELLKRAFLGWLRGEPDHCSMAAVPTLEQEDAKRPSREREGLVGERTRIVNRMKGALARLGVRGFKPTLRKARSAWRRCARRKARRCRRTRSPSCAATWRGCGSCGSRSRSSRRRAWSGWRRSPGRARTRWCACWPGWSGSGSRPPTCWCARCSRASCGTARRWPATPG